MQKLVFKTENGSVTLTNDQKVILDFPPLYLNVEFKRYKELVNSINDIYNSKSFDEEFLNKHITNFEMWKILFDVLSEEQKQEFLKLLNYPLIFLEPSFSIEENFNTTEQEKNAKERLLDICLN